jgi:phage replication initiation protein
LVHVRLEWFQELVGLVKRAKVYLASAPRTAEQLIAWVQKAIAPTLAVVMTVWKGDFQPLEDMIVEGRRRWKPRHKAIVENVSATQASAQTA